MSEFASFTGNLGGQLPENYVVPSESELAFIKIRQYLNDIAYALNRKDSGYFVEQQTVTGQQFVPTFGTDSSSSIQYRPVLRKVVDFGGLPNTGSTSVAHNIPGISSTFSVTRLYGSATDPAALSWIPIPYASPTLADSIELEVDSTNAIITTGSDRTAYTRSFVVIEYITTV